MEKPRPQRWGPPGPLRSARPMDPPNAAKPRPAHRHHHGCTRGASPNCGPGCRRWVSRSGSPRSVSARRAGSCPGPRGVSGLYRAEFLRTLTGPIVLVGHSYGGNVISMAAAGNGQVRALVYFNGWMCEEGDSQQQLLERFEGSLVGPAIRPVPYTGPDGSQGADLFLYPGLFREAFAADFDPQTAAVMAAAQRPYAAAAFAATPAGPPAWKTLPCRYLLGTEDKAIPPALQRFMPGARTQRPWRRRPRTSRWCPSPRPRPGSSWPPSRRRPEARP
jgi:pimeloyl-ACP methyl ester carboxylesterase